MGAPVDGRITAAWPVLRGLPAAPMAGGLINDTYALGDSLVLQRLHPVFAAEVNDDIAALVPTLQAAGVPVPDLLRTASGATCLTLTEGAAAGVWRVLRRLPGRTVHRASGPPQVRAVARALARFHGALVGVDHAFASRRAGIHDTHGHMAALRAALEAHPRHRLRDRVARLAARIFAAWDAFGPLPALPTRIGHGDPKISNFLFADGRDDVVVGIVDLDTVGPTTLDAELGDALRSWCSTGDESAAAPAFDRARFTAAVSGYAEVARGWITEAELRSFSGAPERIALELASRFAADALNESYFRWDPAVAASRGEHNLLRAANQLALARSVRAQRPALEAVVEALAA